MYGICITEQAPTQTHKAASHLTCFDMLDVDKVAITSCACTATAGWHQGASVGGAGNEGGAGGVMGGAANGMHT